MQESGVDVEEPNEVEYLKQQVNEQIKIIEEFKLTNSQLQDAVVHLKQSGTEELQLSKRQIYSKEREEEKVLAISDQLAMDLKYFPKIEPKNFDLVDMVHSLKK